MRTVNILQKVEQIDDVENSYRTGYAASAQLEERYGIVSDHGLEVKSFLKGDQVYKIIESVGLSYGTFEYEYYFWEGEFIYAKVTEKNFAKQDTVNYTYDDINRPTIENWTGGGGNEITYAYDSCSNGIGRLCTATVTGGVSTTYTYAPTGNIKNEVRTISGTGYTTTNLFDRQGNLVQVILPDTSRVRYTYNSAGLAELVERKETTGGWLSVLSDIDYAPTDQVSFMAYTNGVTTTNTYDATKLYRLTQKVSTKSGTNVQDISYTYSPAGDITQIVDASATATSKTANYTYDPLHRLLTATITGVAGGTSAYTQTFTYNAIGNMTTLTGTGGTTYATTQYNGHMGGSFANPHAATKIAGVNRTYDQNGNMLTNGTLTNTWDYRNKLTQTVVGGNTVTYAYDHTGGRTSITDAGVTTVFPSQYQEVKGTNIKKYIYLGSTLLATVENNAGTITPHYAHADHLGGSSVMTSSTGAIDETIDYYPYGELRLDNKVGAFDERHKYTGYEFDATTGLNYAQARYQTPIYGRFISQDPVFWNFGNMELMDPQRQNSYAYARNNPLAYRDPDGNSAKSFMASIFGYVNNIYSIIFGKSNTNFNTSAALPSSDDVNMSHVNSENTVLDSSAWKSQMPDRPQGCFDVCSEIVGYTPNPKNQIDVFSRSGDDIIMTGNTQKAVNTIDSYLEKGNPITVGVFRNPEDGSPNRNSATQHFVVIMGMGYENDQKYYRFFDSGTQWKEKGGSANNRLYLQEDGSLSGYSEYYSKGKYTVTEVRPK